MNKMTHILFFALVALLLFTGTDCKDEPIPPCTDCPPPDTTKPGSRDYVWTVDTLKPPPGDIINLFSMWGSSESDVWAVGHGDVSYNCIWHYNGVKWQRDSVRLSSNHQSIWGFAQNDAWIVDAPNGEQIWHYNGSQWSLFGNYKKPTQSIFYLGNVWGDSPNNVFAVGSEILTSDNKNHAVIMRYDGIDWKYLNISDLNVSFYKLRRNNETGKYYLTGIIFNPLGDTIKVYQFDGTSIEHLTSTTESATVNEIKGRVYIQIGKKIYSTQNTQLALFKDFSRTDFNGRIWGRSEKDFFSISTNGIHHFNGTDIQLIYSTTIEIYDMSIFANDVFALGKSGDYPIVIHGVFKKQ